MLTRIEVKKTYWVGMTDEQKALLTSAIVIVMEKGAVVEDHLNAEQVEALDDLRQALLNA